MCVRKTSGIGIVTIHLRGAVFSRFYNGSVLVPGDFNFLEGNLSRCRHGGSKAISKKSILEGYWEYMRTEYKRQVEFDYAKTIAIFFMVVIHVIEEISIVNVDTLPSGFWENFFQFGAGPMAAPVFVFSMGVGIVFSRNQEPVQLFKRGIKLWVVAMVLNVCRDAIPYLIACLISGNAPVWEEMRLNLFNIDILHFAGLAFMLTALFKKLKVSVLALVPIAIIMQAVGNELSLAFKPSGTAEIFLSYFFNTDGDLSCFPLLTWYAMLAFGILAGTIILTYRDNLDTIYKIGLWGGLSLLIGYVVGFHYYDLDIRYLHALYENAFYRQTFFHFLYNALIIIIEISLLHMITRRMKSNIAFFEFCGKNLTTIYVVQWMIIGWIAAFKDYLHFEPDLGMSVLSGVIIAGAAILITRFLPRIKW